MRNTGRNFLIMLNNLLLIPKTTLLRIIQRIIEANGDLIGNTIADKITRVSRKLPQYSSETVENETENKFWTKIWV